jgi:hypothetical protein
VELHLLNYVEALRIYETAHRLRDRATTGCWKWIAQAIADGELRGTSAEEIELRVYRSALVFSSTLVSNPYFETTVGILAKNRPNPMIHGGLEQLGRYRLITDLDGSDVDDHFDLEDRRPGAE